MSGTSEPQHPMAEQRWQDIVLLTLAGIALCVESAVLLGQMRIIRLPFGWGEDERARPVIGSVIAKSHSVNSRSLSSLTWYPMAEGDRVHADDTVMTGDDSSAVIRLGHDEEIVLQPHTLVRFTVNRARNADAFLSFELNQGTVRVASHRASHLRVKVPSRVIELKPDSEAVVTAAPLSAQADVRVDRGGAQIDQAMTLAEAARESSPGATAPVEPAVELKSGEAARLSPGRGLAKLDTHLSISPLNPAPKARLGAAGDFGNVHFKWEGAPGDAVEWDESPDFNSPSSVRSIGMEAQAQIKPGTYYWRVRQSISTSDAQPFTIVPRPRYRLIEPAPGTSMRAGAPIALSWEAISDATAYTLQVSDRADFSHILREEELERPRKQLPKMKPGKYYWRVAASTRRWGRMVASETASFVITKKRAAPPKPKGAKVLPSRTQSPKAPTSDARAKGGGRLSRQTTPAESKTPISSWLERLGEWLEPSAFAEPARKESIEAKTKAPTLWMDFEWEPSPDATRYRLEISLEQSFNKPLARLDVSDTHAVVELPDQTKFFWRLASIDDDGELGPFTETQVMERSRAVTKEEAQRRIAEAEARKQALLKKRREEQEKRRALASLEAKKKEAPPPKPRSPFWRTHAAKLGYGASFLTESQTAPAYTMAQSGFPLNQLRAAIAAQLSGMDFEGRFLFQRFLAQPIDGHGTGEVRYTDWSAEFLFPGAIEWGVPWSVGVALGTEGDFTRGADQISVTATSELVTSVLFGPRFSLRQDKTHDWRLETLAELTPLVGRHGAGLIARSVFAFPHAFSGLWGEKLAPAFELAVHPTYRIGHESGAHCFAIEATAALSLTWMSDGQTAF